MKTLKFIFAILVLSSSAYVATANDGVPSGKYLLDPTHSYIIFSYSHIGFSNPILRFRKFNGELNYDAKTIANSNVSVTIDAATIDGGFDKFNEDLRAEDFFNTAKYPEIAFKSNSYQPVVDNSGKGKLQGTLTVKGNSQPVSLDVTFNKAAPNPFTKAPVVGFSAQGTFSRAAFGVDKYAPAVGDNITLNIEVEFTLKQ